jgi:hypothetical protein
LSSMVMAVSPWNTCALPGHARLRRASTSENH